MEIKRGIYPNCSEWDQELYGDYYIPNEKDDKDVDEALEAVKKEDWD
jgi:hypothetical protein